MAVEQLRVENVTFSARFMVQQACACTRERPLVGGFFHPRGARQAVIRCRGDVTRTTITASIRPQSKFINAKIRRDFR